MYSTIIKFDVIYKGIVVEGEEKINVLVDISNGLDRIEDMLMIAYVEILNKYLFEFDKDV